jgi:hypothetical protein
MVTAVARRSSRSNAGSSASPGSMRGSTSRTRSGIGTRPRRSCLGRLRSRAVTSSSRSPGTVNASDSADTTPSSIASGTSTVTPSSAVPGAKA